MNKKEILLFSDQELEKMSTDGFGTSSKYNDLSLSLQCAVLDAHIPDAVRNTEAGIEGESILIKIFTEVNPVIVICNSSTGYSCRVAADDVVAVRKLIHERMINLTN